MIVILPHFCPLCKAINIIEQFSCTAEWHFDYVRNCVSTDINTQVSDVHVVFVNVFNSN